MKKREREKKTERERKRKRKKKVIGLLSLFPLSVFFHFTSFD